MTAEMGEASDGASGSGAACTKGVINFITSAGAVHTAGAEAFLSNTLEMARNSTTTAGDTCTAGEAVYFKHWCNRHCKIKMFMLGEMSAHRRKSKTFKCPRQQSRILKT